MNTNNATPAARDGGVEGTESPLESSAIDMANAQEHGLVKPLFSLLTHVVKFQGHWWIADQDLWLLIDQPDLIADIEAHFDTVNTTLLPRSHWRWSGVRVSWASPKVKARLDEAGPLSCPECSSG